MTEVTLIEAVRALLTVAVYISEQTQLGQEATDSLATIRRGLSKAEAIAEEAKVAGRPLADHAAREYVGNVLDVAQWWFDTATEKDIPMPADGEVREATQRLLIIDNNL